MEMIMVDIVVVSGFTDAH